MLAEHLIANPHAETIRLDGAVRVAPSCDGVHREREVGAPVLGWREQ